MLGRLGQLAIGDIRDRAGHAHDAALGVAQRLATRAEPAIAAAGAKPDLDVVGRVPTQVGHQRAAIAGDVFGMHRFERPPGIVPRRLRGNLEQLGGPRRVVGRATRHVPVPHAVVAAADGQGEALLAQPQGALRKVVADHQSARQQDRKSDQRGRQAQHRQQQDPFGLARRDTERARKLLLEWRELPADDVDPVYQRMQRLGVCIARLHPMMDLACEPRDLRNPLVGLRPDGDRIHHERDMSEIVEQVDHPGHIVGVVPACQHACAGDFKIGRRRGRRQASTVVAQRNGDVALEVAEVRFLVRAPVAIEEVGRLLLSLCPQALGAHVGTHCRKHLDADSAQDHQQRDCGDKRHVHTQETLRERKRGQEAPCRDHVELGPARALRCGALRTEPRCTPRTASLPVTGARLNVTISTPGPQGRADGAEES